MSSISFLVEIPAGGEEVAVHVRHEEQGRSRVEGEAALAQVSHAATGLGVLLEHFDIEALETQPDRRREASYTGPNDRDTFLGQQTASLRPSRPR